jgi:hypothetical protein
MGVSGIPWALFKVIFLLLVMWVVMWMTKGLWCTVVNIAEIGLGSPKFSSAFLDCVHLY